MIDMIMLKAKIREGIQRIPADKALMFNKEMLQAIEKIFTEALLSPNTNLENILNHINQLNNKELFLAKVPDAVLDIIKPYYHNELRFMLPLFFEPEEGQEQVTEQDLKSLFNNLLLTHLNKLLSRSEFDIETTLLPYKEVKQSFVKAAHFSAEDQLKAELDDIKPMRKFRDVK
ncbi:hypothetical protein [Candidatus Berkiella aquae]|uniref:Uncharacterized protein n=1 Tax=Candidatus Berkiella aquae TaxID=295108 RepID=A0A0Q9YVN7_9GAMM|nr:hypothetical protein [Candidatus Berkiella aquae]MCS5710530.1 hypothetical protein [Candidatus Berkiella aquae]